MEIEINGRRFPVCPGSGQPFEPRCPVCGVRTWGYTLWTMSRPKPDAFIGTHPALRGK